MTIPEASGLVMQAGAMAGGGDLFVLDMGKPVKIIDLAENMVKLSGLTPYSDIDIVEIGLRPGEKLFEEYLLSDADKYLKTANDMIYIEKDTDTTSDDAARIESMLRLTLNDPICETDGSIIKRVLSQIIPDYTPKY